MKMQHRPGIESAWVVTPDWERAGYDCGLAQVPTVGSRNPAAQQAAAIFRSGFGPKPPGGRRMGEDHLRAALQGLVVVA